MTITDKQAMREKFESVCRARGMLTTGYGSGYVADDTNRAWYWFCIALEAAEAASPDMCERICAAIKAADDKGVDEADYMLDSKDCIRIVREQFAAAPSSAEQAGKPYVPAQPAGPEDMAVYDRISQRHFDATASSAPAADERTFDEVFRSAECQRAGLDRGWRGIAQFVWNAASAQAAAAVAVGELRKLCDLSAAVVRAAFFAADDCTDGGGDDIVVDRPSWDELSAALDALDELPEIEDGQNRLGCTLLADRIQLAISGLTTRAQPAAPVSARAGTDTIAEAAAIVREILGPGGGMRCDSNLVDMLRTLQCVVGARAQAGEAVAPVAFVPVHPVTGPLWADAYSAEAGHESRVLSYPRMALYAAPPADARDGEDATSVAAAKPVGYIDLNARSSWGAFAYKPIANKASQAEFTRLRAVEARYCYLRAQLQVTRNAAVPDCISLEYIRAEETEPDDADYIDAYIDRQLRALAEACGRKG